MSVAICWFHNDYRLTDHPALTAAVRRGSGVIPLAILDEAAAGKWAMGGASRWWLHHSLASLDADLRALGSRLIVAVGAADEVLDVMVERHRVGAVFTHHRREPWAQNQLGRVHQVLDGRVEWHESEGVLLKTPGEVLSKTGTRLRVFTPFKRSLLALAESIRPALPCPEAIPAPQTWPQTTPIEALDLLPKNPDWSGGIRSAWQVGEAAATKALDSFLATSVGEYKTARDIPSIKGTSRLSPHLHFGEISPVSIYHRVKNVLGAGAETFLSEVIWREFSYELLDQFPHLPETPLRPEFGRFPWRDDYAEDLAAWQAGRTGFPLVDAGMRELTATGWMHNRVRMITASFLCKHLLIPWQEGAAWFWDRLVDADLASNSASWQWVAGCGADAAPYFRVFNPISQGHKFSAHAYVRHWLPEIASRDDATLFAPDEADLLNNGGDYIPPLISHSEGRDRALNAFAQIKKEE